MEWWKVFIYAFLLSGVIICGLVILSQLYSLILRWLRRRAVDRRIIRQAKAAGVWDKTPIVLGGRALELKAWKDYKIKRKPGETDYDLRISYMIAQVYGAKTAHYKVNKRKRKKELVEKVKQIAAKHGYKDIKVKTDGYNVEVSLNDITLPQYIEATVRYEDKETEEKQ